MTDQQTISDLSMLVRRLIAKLDKVAPKTPLAKQAREYLARKGLNGSPLRKSKTPVKDFFKGRIITPEMAAEGYNNQQRGKLIGYITDPKQHEAKCQYVKTTGKNSCTCHIGLWQEPRP